MRNRQWPTFHCAAHRPTLYGELDYTVLLTDPHYAVTQTTLYCSETRTMQWVRLHYTAQRPTLCSELDYTVLLRDPHYTDPHCGKWKSEAAVVSGGRSHCGSNLSCQGVFLLLQPKFPSVGDKICSPRIQHAFFGQGINTQSGPTPTAKWDFMPRPLADYKYLWKPSLNIHTWASVQIIQDRQSPKAPGRVQLSKSADVLTDGEQHGNNTVQRLLYTSNQIRLDWTKWRRWTGGVWDEMRQCVQVSFYVVCLRACAHTCKFYGDSPFLNAHISKMCQPTLMWCGNKISH